MSTGIQGCPARGCTARLGAGDACDTHAHISGRFHFTDNYSLIDFSEDELGPVRNNEIKVPVCARNCKQPNNKNMVPGPEVSHPETVPSPEVSRPGTVPSPVVSLPWTVPSPVVSRPWTVPSPVVSGPWTVPSPVVSGPWTVPSPEVSRPVMVPSPEVSRPVTVPSPEVSRPVTVPSPEVSRPVMMFGPKMESKEDEYKWAIERQKSRRDEAIQCRELQRHQETPIRRLKLLHNLSVAWWTKNNSETPQSEGPVIPGEEKWQNVQAESKEKKSETATDQKLTPFKRGVQQRMGEKKKNANKKWQNSVKNVDLQWDLHSSDAPKKLKQLNGFQTLISGKVETHEKNGQEAVAHHSLHGKSVVNYPKVSLTYQPHPSSTSLSFRNRDIASKRGHTLTNEQQRKSLKGSFSSLIEKKLQREESTTNEASAKEYTAFHTRDPYQKRWTNFEKGAPEYYFQVSNKKKHTGGNVSNQHDNYYQNKGSPFSKESKTTFAMVGDVTQHHHSQWVRGIKRDYNHCSVSQGYTGDDGLRPRVQHFQSPPLPTPTFRPAPAPAPFRSSLLHTSDPVKPQHPFLPQEPPNFRFSSEALSLPCTSSLGRSNFLPLYTPNEPFPQNTPLEREMINGYHEIRTLNPDSSCNYRNVVEYNHGLPNCTVTFDHPHHPPIASALVVIWRE
uniref:Uncharacterized protein n=1 Tax=Eptatretus burgeri TaxID=7764 RepID=A0A8C4QKV4_EPTBU